MRLFYKLKMIFMAISFVARFVSGRALDGKQRTNARFWAAGTRALTKDGYASRWALQPGWFRLVVRLSVLLSPCVIPAGLHWYPVTTVSLLVTASGWLTWVLGRRAYRLARYPMHYRRYVRPAARVLRPALGYPVNHPARMFLTVPRDYANDPKALVEVKVPADKPYTREQQVMIDHIVSTKLAMPDMDSNWVLGGEEPTVFYHPTPRPKDLVKFADVRHLMEALPEGHLFIGLARGDVAQTHSLDDEDPHILISMRTGGGKSALARLLAAKVLRDGGEVVILDFKRNSHTWARGVDGVKYCRDIADIHNALVDAAMEVQNLNRQTDDNPTMTFRRKVFLIEELNATMSQLRTYWEMNRTKDDPKTSPAIIAFGLILFMGRTAKRNVIAIGQRLSSKALGDPDFRDQFGLKLMARYSLATWRMVVPEATAPRVSWKHRGRLVVVKNGQTYETQSVFITDDEATRWATERNVPAVSYPALPAETTRHVLGQQPQSVTSGLVTLREAADDMLTGLAALQRASTRDTDFPKSRGKKGSANLYDPNELKYWERNRVSPTLKKESA